MIRKKTCNSTPSYRSPTQGQDYFQAFIDNLEINLENLAQENLFITVVIDDFIAKFKNRCGQDTTNFDITREV